MAISDRITSIEEHIKESYQELEGIGIDTTGVNNNLENIPKLIDGYWETLPKVTGEGTSITLDNTKEGKMKINLKGNTSQATTTGKNLLGINSISGTMTTGVNYTFNNSEMVLNGTATGGGTLVGIGKIFQKANTTYTFTYFYDSGTCTDYGAGLFLSDTPTGTTNIGGGGGFRTSQGRNMTLNTSTSDRWLYLYLNMNNNSTYTNYKLKLQIEEGSTATSYEPYTNGASPNPDYPQDIHIVSGDNNINVVGKNYFNNNLPSDIKAVNCSQTFNDGKIVLTATGADIRVGEVFNAGTSWISEYGELIPVKPNTKYSIKLTNSLINKNFVTYCNKEKVSIGTFTFFNQFATFTTPNDTQYVVFRIGYGSATSGTSYSFNIMLVEGEYTTQTIPDYEPYQGNTYPINLGVENLWHLDNATNNGVTLTNNDDGSITLNGTCTSTNQFRTTFDTSLSSDTYTLSFVSSVALSTGSLYVRTRNSNGVLAQNLDVKVTSANQTVTSDIKYLDITIINGVTYNNVNLKIQFEKGSKANSFTPYGTTPIELCKIGTYQDVIKKSTGKNLLPYQSQDFTINNVRYYCNNGNLYLNGTSTGETYQTNQTFKDNFSFYLEAGTYTFKQNILDSGSANYFGKSIVRYSDNSTIAYINNSNSQTTFTLTERTQVYLGFYVYQKTFNNETFNIQLEKGSQATPYEPYGTGWYVKKEIGKIVLNGSEAWTYYQNHLILGQSASSINMIPSTNQTLCNYYAYTSQGQDKRFTTGNSFSIQVFDSSYTDTTTFKNWLSTHNITVYYALNTPTYTGITGELLSQLNALAKSYTSQTNISQNSNDLASLLNATALEEM